MIEGCRLIINIVVEGCTQYRTQVQGMPKQVENLLTRMINEFLWNSEARQMIGINTL